MLAAAVDTAAAAPRVASLDLCTDDLLVALADPADIASLSPMASDPGVSLVAAQAKTLPNNDGNAEAVLAERPDLVLAEAGAAVGSVALLRKIGIRVESIDEPRRLAGIPALVRQVAALVGQPERGEVLIAAMQEKLARLAATGSNGQRPKALFYDSNGISPGADTIENDVLAAIGIDNQATALTREFGGPMSVETILADPPDLLVTQSYRAGEASLAEAGPDHPALLRVTRRVRIANALLICPTPSVVDAAAILAAAAYGS